MINPGMMSSNTDEWATPQDFFDKVSAEFGPFDVDVCANAENAKAPRWFGKTPAGGGLNEQWLGKVWMNPPYGREIKHWVKKASESASLGGAIVVCLLPARTDTGWWHDYIEDEYGNCRPGVHRRSIRGRLKFGGAKWNAPFPSALVVFRPAISNE